MSSRTGDEYAEYRAFWAKRRRQEITPEAATRAAEARREAERLSRLLIEKFAARAVYLFGSLAWDGGFGAQSDIDLAATGIPPERYFEAVGYLLRKSRFAVDLLDLKKVPEHLRQRILTTGILLDEHKQATMVGG